MQLIRLDYILDHLAPNRSLSQAHVLRLAFPPFALASTVRITVLVTVVVLRGRVIVEVRVVVVGTSSIST